MPFWRFKNVTKSDWRLWFICMDCNTYCESKLDVCPTCGKFHPVWKQVVARKVISWDVPFWILFSGPTSVTFELKEDSKKEELPNGHYAECNVNYPTYCPTAKCSCGVIKTALNS